MAAACICLPGLQGNPYIECKPECTLNTECQDHLACVQQKCVDPCPGVCGQNARCKVQFHNPTCICDFGFYGDPFSSCVRTTSMNYFTNNFNLIKEVNINYLFLAPPAVTRPVDPCNPSPCGSNAICSERNHAAACQCIPEYFGDPYVACRPECVVNSDCPSDKACQRNKCIDPCPGTCGINAACRILNHIPTCSCIEGYIGDPFTSCRLVPIREFFKELLA